MGVEIAVLDTSSLIHVRRLLSSERSSEKKRVFAALTALVVGGTLTFPLAVHDELKHAHGALDGDEDLPFDWTAANLSHAVASEELFALVRDVLAVVPNVLDYSKTSPVDEADPYVVALGLRLKSDGRDVTILTEERNSSPIRTSLADACGLLRLPTLSMRTFLGSQRIWPR